MVLVVKEPHFLPNSQQIKSSLDSFVHVFNLKELYFWSLPSFSVGKREYSMCLYEGSLNVKTNRTVSVLSFVQL